MGNIIRQIALKKCKYVFLAAGALLTGLTLVLPVFGFIEWFSLVPVAIVLLSYNAVTDEKVKLRKVYGNGLFFFMCYFLVSFHWFVNLYPLDFIDGMTKGAALSVVLVAWIGLSFLQALGGGFVFVLFAIVCRSHAVMKYGILRSVSAAALWAVFEWTQTLGWFGVPWARLAIGQTAYLAEIQTASWFGTYFITFLIVAVNFLIASALLAERKKTVRAFALCAALLFAFNTVAGAALYLHKTDGEKVKIAAIQGNISSRDKWDISSIDKTLDVYEKYTIQAAEEGADIVVFPESALPYTLSRMPTLQEYVSSLARKTGTTVIVGAFTESEDGISLNTLIPVYSDGTILQEGYSKRRLVPFGEFVPMRGLISTLIPPLTELGMLDDDLAAGSGAQIMNIDGMKIGGLICFDSIYEELTRESALGGAQVIVLSTNDSWFADSAALFMHNAQAQLRAVESGKFVIRSANTGISTAINEKGKVLQELAPLTEGYFTQEITLNSRTTLYTVIGNSFVYICISFLLAILLDVMYKKIAVKSQIRLDETA